MKRLASRIRALFRRRERPAVRERWVRLPPGVAAELAAHRAAWARLEAQLAEKDSPV